MDPADPTEWLKLAALCSLIAVLSAAAPFYDEDGSEEFAGGQFPGGNDRPLKFGAFVGACCFGLGALGILSSSG